MAIDKSKWNTNIKVSQKTIDEIKKMGMKKALGTVAGATKSAKTDASAKIWAEGVKRLYGANRVAAAVKAGTVKYSSPDAARSAAAKPATKKKMTGGNTVPAQSRPSLSSKKVK